MVSECNLQVTVLYCRWCPSVFFYLLSTVPAIWFLELDQLKRRLSIGGLCHVTNITDSLSQAVLNSSAPMPSVDEVAFFVQSLGVSWWLPSNRPSDQFKVSFLLYKRTPLCVSNDWSKLWQTLAQNCLISFGYRQQS